MGRSSRNVTCTISHISKPITFFPYRAPQFSHTVLTAAKTSPNKGMQGGGGDLSHNRRHIKDETLPVPKN